MNKGQMNLGRLLVYTGLIGLTLGSVRYLLMPQGGTIGVLLASVTVGLSGLACARRWGRGVWCGYLLGLGVYILFGTAAEVHPRSAAGAIMSRQTQGIYYLLDGYLSDWATNYVEENEQAYDAVFVGLPLLCWGGAVGGIVACCSAAGNAGLRGRLRGVAGRSPCP